MKSSDATFRTHLYGQNVHTLADAFTFYFPSPIGTQRWTSWSSNLTFGGNTWSASGPVMGRVSAKSAVGVEVADVNVTLDPGSLTLNGVPMRTAALRRSFNGVRLVIERAYLANDAASVVGMLVIFDGTISDVVPNSTGIEIAAVSAVARLRTLLPRRLVAASCPFDVYSSQCGAVKASFTDSRTVAAGTTTTMIRLSSSSTRAVPGGWVVVGSESRTVRSVSGADVYLAAPPLPSVPTTGTAVSVVRGCAGTIADCTVFGRLVSFGGAPFTPRSESV